MFTLCQFLSSRRYSCKQSNDASVLRTLNIHTMQIKKKQKFAMLKSWPLRGILLFFFVRSLAPTRLLEKCALIIRVFQRALEAAAIANKASKSPEGTDSQLRGAAFKYKPHSSSNRRSTFLRVLFINHSFLTRYKPFPRWRCCMLLLFQERRVPLLNFLKRCQRKTRLYSIPFPRN